MARKSKFAELRIFELENLTVNGAIEILNSKNEKRKFILIKDLAGKVLARRIKVTGEGENAIKIEVYLPQNNGKTAFHVKQGNGNGNGDGHKMDAAPWPAGILPPSSRL